GAVRRRRPDPGLPPKSGGRTDRRVGIRCRPRPAVWGGVVADGRWDGPPPPERTQRSAPREDGHGLRRRQSSSPPSSTNDRYLSSSRIGEYFSRSVVPAGAAATAVAGTAAATTAVASTVSGWGADHGSDRDAVGHGRPGLGVGGEDHPEATGVVDGLI